MKIHKKSQLSNLPFKCPLSMCTVRMKKWRDISVHYKTNHGKLHNCSHCNKQYVTPYSLKQHQYKHIGKEKQFECKRCGQTFPFFSQFHIHHIKHSQKLKFECLECCQNYKFKHDMQKHLKEHTAKEYQCGECEYIGTNLNLKAHVKQHKPEFYPECPLCHSTFKHRMSYWQHQQVCKRSGSPEY